MPEIRFEASSETVAVIDGYCSATGRCRTEVINALLNQWASSGCRRQSGIVGGGPETMKKTKIRTAAQLSAALYKLDGPDTSALARRCEDLALELHGLGNELHKAGLHRQGTAANVAAGMIEDIQEELKNG